MNKRQYIGKQGEKIAINYLEKRGYTIVDRNYRYARSEIDIIAKESSCLIFVEVKTRNGTLFGYPEMSVNDKKIENIMIAADNYIFQQDWKNDIRFDIIAINFDPAIEITHFKDAFY